jgi:hypothetical protein
MKYNHMKIKAVLSFIICAYCIFTGCAPRKENGGKLIHINVSATYPEKTIKLEELAGIEYLQLEVHDDFLFRGLPAAVTNNKIIIPRFDNGEILTFSRNGKPISKFNRKGSAPGDFSDLRTVVYDEGAQEFFIQTSNNRTFVYSAEGKYLRDFALKGNLHRQYLSFDSETLLLYDNYYFERSYPTSFSLISKQDGSIVKSIDLPKNEPIMTAVIYQTEDAISVYTAPANHIVKYNEGFLLTDFALDTVYFYSQETEFVPIITRTPAIQSMNPVVYLNSFVEGGDYQFFTSVTVRQENGRLPQTHLMRNITIGSVYRQRITLNDFQGKEINLSPTAIANTQNSRLGLIELDLAELQDANEEGKLSGRLKEMVENSEEDGNNIFMLLHFK